MDRELFVRSIPPEMTSAEEIDLGPSLPPLAFTRQQLIDAAVVVDPSADITRPGRININLHRLRIAIAATAEEPFTTVLIRVFGQSDQRAADHFVAELLNRLDARAFDTASPGLI